jgi:heme-degrading monooxygenase HmoA
MFCVIFEVQPKRGRTDDYLALAKHLKPKLEATDGFIDNERYASRRTEGRVLSLSTWRDEKAVVRWRVDGEHHVVQEKGRFEVFEDYRLRVGEVTDDSAPPSGLGVVAQRLDETAKSAAKAVSITELAAPPDDLAARLDLDPRADGLVDHEAFESLYHPGRSLLLVTWRDAAAVARWSPRPAAHGEGLRHRRVRVIRDYGLRDRDEAPQFYPEVQSA